MRQVRLRCSIGGMPATLVFRPLDAIRLEVTSEGVETAPRTVSVQPQSLAELVGRQLSDASEIRCSPKASPPRRCSRRASRLDEYARMRRLGILHAQVPCARKRRVRRV